MFKKSISLILSLILAISQPVFAQGLSQLNMAQYLGQNNAAAVDRFRPAQLRYLSYDNFNNSFRILLDKGDDGDVEDSRLKEEAKELMDYFRIGLTLSNDAFWVNLRPDSPDNIIDPELGQTELGRILLEADLQLKKDTAGWTSPQTPEGRAYWDKLYKKAGELFGTENITIPTLTRPWIVPGEIVVRESQDSAYIYKATLKVILEEDYLKNSTNSINSSNSTNYSFNDPRLKELNQYSTRLIRETIIPKLNQEVNSGKRYAKLRQAYYSLVLSRWFKMRFRQNNSAPEGTLSALIDRHDLTGLTSKEPYDKLTYFKQYQESFAKGEYNLTEPVYAPHGQTIRTYMSGGFNAEYMNFSGPEIKTEIAGSPAEQQLLAQPGKNTVILDNNFNIVDPKQPLALAASALGIKLIDNDDKYSNLRYVEYEKLSDLIRAKLWNSFQSVASDANVEYNPEYSWGFVVELNKEEVIGRVLGAVKYKKDTETEPVTYVFGNSPEDIENITAALKAKTKQKRADSASPLTAGQFVQQLDQLTAEVVGGTTSASDAFQSILSALLNVQDKDSSISGRNVRENVGRILEKAALIKSDVYESVSGEFNRASMSSKNQNFTVNKLIEQVRKSLGQGVSIHRQKYQGMLSKIMSYFGFWHTIRNPKISRRIVFLGPPGAGKGTYATEITKKYGLAHISTGDLLRQEVAKKTDLGNNAKAFMESGQLVPDSLVQEILIQRFKQDDAKNGFILDGYPRNQAQAEALDAQLKENGQFIDFVLDLQASEATIVKRISGRRVCKICSATYHILNNPPKVGGVCDKDGGELSQRNDDKEGIVKNRIFVYNQATRPLLDYYHQQRKIYPLNANETLNVVVAGINKTVRDYDLNSIKKTVKELSVGVGQNEWVSIKQLLEKTGYPSTEIHKRSKEAVASLEAIEEIKRLESLLPAAASPLTLGNALNAIGNARAKLNKHHVKTIRDFSKVSLPDLITAVKSTAEEVERVGGIDSSKEKDKWLAIAKELLELQDIVSANMAAYKKDLADFYAEIGKDPGEIEGMNNPYEIIEAIEWAYQLWKDKSSISPGAKKTEGLYSSPLDSVKIEPLPETKTLIEELERLLEKYNSLKKLNDEERERRNELIKQLGESNDAMAIRVLAKMLEPLIRSYLVKWAYYKLKLFSTRANIRPFLDTLNTGTGDTFPHEYYAVEALQIIEADGNQPMIEKIRKRWERFHGFERIKPEGPWGEMSEEEWQKTFKQFFEKWSSNAFQGDQIQPSAEQINVYFEKFGLSKDISADVFKKKARATLMENHPDRHMKKSEEEQKYYKNKTRELLEAYEVITNWYDEQKRNTISSPITQDLGGIDFTERAMRIGVEPMGNFVDLKLVLPEIANVAELNLDGEFRQIQIMVASGIRPADTRLLEFVAACYYRGEFNLRLGEITVCLQQAHSLDEGLGRESSQVLRLVTMLPDALHSYNLN